MQKTAMPFVALRNIVIGFGPVSGLMSGTDPDLRLPVSFMT